MNQSIASIATLPQLPVQMHPLVGMGLVEQRLITHCGFESAEKAIADYRIHHSPEKLAFRRVYYITPQERDRNKVVVRYLWDMKKGKGKMVGTTINDVSAIQILIGNSMAGCYLPDIRWELYEDREGEELIGMGRIDQWDLLKGISADELEGFQSQGIMPAGDWDFNKWLWPTKCSVCGAEVSINSYVFDIDSGVCTKCGNRPYLAPSLHNLLDSMRVAGEDAYLISLRALDWISHVGSTFGEVRRNEHDIGGKIAESLCWKGTLMARSLDDHTAYEVRKLIESKTDFSFGMYRECSDKIRWALIGKERFTEEHKIAMDFVARVTRLLRMRQLTTTTH